MIRNVLRDPDVVEEDGFRLRGLDATRLETFIDAAFAFAVTMLALNPDSIPETYAELVTGLKGVPSLIASLALLMLFWRAHERFSRRYGLEDGVTVFLGVGLIAAVMIYVYPLKFMFDAAFRFMIPPLRTEAFEGAIGSWQELSNMFVIYGVGWIGFQALFLLLFIHAYRRRAFLELNALEVHDTVTEIREVVIYMVVGVISIVLAKTLAGTLWVISSGIIYASFGLLMPLNHRLRRPARERLRQSRDGAA